MAFAGLWETWTDRSSGEIIESCTILTTAANQVMNRIHHRMPVMIKPDDYGLWLDGQAHKIDEYSTIFQPLEDSLLKLTPVSKYVNKAGNEGTQCIEPA